MSRIHGLDHKSDQKAHENCQVPFILTPIELHWPHLFNLIYSILILAPWTWEKIRSRLQVWKINHFKQVKMLDWQPKSTQIFQELEIRKVSHIYYINSNCVTVTFVKLQSHCLTYRTCTRTSVPKIIIRTNWVTVWIKLPPTNEQ